MEDDEDQYFIKLAYKFSRPDANSYPLLNATCNGDLEGMKELIEGGVDVNQKTEQRITSVWCACYHGNSKALQLLLESNADPDIADIYQQTPLFVACYQGNFENIQLLISYGSTITFRDYESHTALHSASDAGREEIIRFLIATDNEQREHALSLGQKLDETLVNMKDVNGNAAIHYAAANNQMDCVDALLSGGAEVDIRNHQQKTPLHIASELGHDYVVDILIDEGAELDSRDEDGRTPLHIACAEGKNLCVDLLLANGASLIVLDDFGLSALHLAALNSHIDVVRLLCQGIEIEDEKETSIVKAIDPNIKDGQGRSAMHAAAESGNIAICDLLQQFGTDVHHLDNFGRSPLHYCSIWGDSHCVEWFVKHAVDINGVDHMGRTALHYVCYFGNFAAANALLQNGAEVNVQDLLGETPLLASLHEFDNNDKSEIVELLMEFKADTSITELRGRTPLHICASTGDIETLELLLDNHVERKLKHEPNSESKISKDYINQPSVLGHTALHLAVANKQLDNFEFLVQRDGNVNAKDLQGNSVLMWAIKSNSVECFNYLVEDCNVDYEDSNNNGDTALTLAISLNHYEFVQKLLEANPKLVNYTSPSGKTPLLTAAFADDPSMISLLTTYSSKLLNFNDADPNGRTAMHRAARKGNKESLGTLIKHGADINKQDKDGVTPLIVAAFHGHQEVIGYLIRAGADKSLLDSKGRDYQAYLRRFLSLHPKKPEPEDDEDDEDEDSESDSDEDEAIATPSASLPLSEPLPVLPPLPDERSEETIRDGEQEKSKDDEIKESPLIVQQKDQPPDVEITPPVDLKEEEVKEVKEEVKEEAKEEVKEEIQEEVKEEEVKEVVKEEDKEEVKEVVKEEEKIEQAPLNQPTEVTEDANKRTEEIEEVKEVQEVKEIKDTIEKVIEVKEIKEEIKEEIKVEVKDVVENIKGDKDIKVIEEDKENLNKENKEETPVALPPKSPTKIPDNNSHSNINNINQPNIRNNDNSQVEGKKKAFWQRYLYLILSSLTAVLAYLFYFRNKK